MVYPTKICFYTKIRTLIVNNRIRIKTPHKRFAVKKIILFISCSRCRHKNVVIFLGGCFQRFSKNSRCYTFDVELSHPGFDYANGSVGWNKRIRYTGETFFSRLEGCQVFLNFSNQISRIFFLEVLWENKIQRYESKYKQGLLEPRGIKLWWVVGLFCTSASWDVRGHGRDVFETVADRRFGVRKIS